MPISVALPIWPLDRTQGFRSHAGYCEQVPSQICKRRGAHFSGDGTYKTNVEDLVLWGLACSGAVKTYGGPRNSQWQSWRMRAEDGEAVKLGMRVLPQEFATKLPPEASAENILTDITIDDGPSHSNLQESWPGVRMVRRSTRQDKRQALAAKDGCRVERAHLGLGLLHSRLAKLVKLSAPWKFWTRKLATAGEADEARYITTTILKRSGGEFWDASWRKGLGNMSKRDATERGQCRVKDILPTGSLTQTAGKASRQHSMSMGAMVSHPCLTRCLLPNWLLS